MITGYTKKIQQRSVLYSAEGFITYIIESPRTIRSKGDMWNVLRRYYASNIVDSIRGMKILKSEQGVVFDIPLKLKDMFEEIAEDLKNDEYKVFPPTELPEVQESFQGGYDRGRRDGGRNSYGRYGGRDGGRRDGGRRDGGRRDFGRGDRFGDRGGYGNGRSERPERKREGERDYKKLFVANLSFDTTVRDLRNLFEDKNHRPYDVYIVKN